MLNPERRSHPLRRLHFSTPSEMPNESADVVIDLNGRRGAGTSRAAIETTKMLLLSGQRVRFVARSGVHKPFRELIELELQDKADCLTGAMTAVKLFEVRDTDEWK